MTGTNAEKMTVVWKACLALVLAFALCAFAVIRGEATFGISRYFYLKVDLLGFVTATAIIVVAAALTQPMPRPWIAAILALNPPRIRSWHLAVIATILTILGTRFIYHGYAFSMDEWMTQMQAEIFRNGHLSGIVPEEWRAYGGAMYHSFAAYDPLTGRVASDYRPGMAALYALFDLAGSGVYTAAILNGLAILLTAAVALKLWPGRRDIALLAAFLVFSSQQALATAMTSYAMSAHLCFNLLWLYLFLRNDWWGHIGAVLVAAATTALHQIHVHLFFAAPFFFILLRPFRPGLLVFYGIGYAASLLLVYSWDWWSINQHLTGTETAARNLLERVIRIIRIPSLNEALTIAANLVRFVAWQNLILLPLIAACGPALVKDKWLRLLAAATIMSLLPYIFLMPDQGHGWGYRYLHGLIGPVALIGAYGGTRLLAAAKDSRSIVFLGMVAIASIFVMLPLRAWQIHGEVTPFARATAFAKAQQADVVIVDSERIFIGGDIVRNSAIAPSRPIQMRLGQLTPEQISALCRDYTVIYLGPEQFPKEIDLISFAAADLEDEENYLRKIALLNSNICNS